MDSVYISRKNSVGIPFSLDWHGFFKHITLQEGKGETWSIAVEFKFYFVLPALALMFVFVRAFGVSAAMLFFIALLLLSQFVFQQADAEVNDTRLLPYMPIFIMGMFIAAIQNEINHNNKYSEGFRTVFKLLGYVGIIGVTVMVPLVFSLLEKKFQSHIFINSLFYMVYFGLSFCCQPSMLRG